jgi:hypothetical protein
MLLMADQFLSVLDHYRILWIAGRFGGHKTSLGFELARRYCEQGFYLVSNCPNVWADDFRKITLDENRELKSVILLDEGGLEFKVKSQVENIASYCRKVNIRIIMPSFWPPTRAAQVVTVQPVFSLIAIGIPLIFYRWRVKLQYFDEMGWFGWWNPRRIYGIYSSKDPGDKAGEIVRWLVSQAKAYRESYGYDQTDDGISGVEVTEEDVFSDAASEIAGAADDISLSFRKGRRKRY